VIVLRIALTCILLACCQSALALNPALYISQYGHTSWKIRDGFTKGYIRTIAQTPDGYLWLGTEFGLVRFDGVRPVPWQPPPDQHLPSNLIFSLLTARDGTLWIGTSKGLVSWKDGKLTQYPELASQYIFRLIEDHEGTVWVGGAGVPIAKLCSVQNGHVNCYAEDGSLGRAVLGLFEESKGNLWVSVVDGLWRWKPGPPKFYPLPGEGDSVQGFAEDDNGATLFDARGGIKRIVEGKIEDYPLPGNVNDVKTHRMLRDRDGGLWLGTFSSGLMHVHQGRTDVLSSSDGLSGNDVGALFEDREGNIWVATNNGLDRFRDVAVAAFSVNQGLSNEVVGSVLADRDGSVWLSTYGGLHRWSNGQITIARTGSGKPDGKLNGLNPNSLFQDDGGRIWVSTLRDTGYLENDRFITVSSFSSPPVLAIVQDKAEDIWIDNEGVGLVQLSREGEVQRIPWAALGHKDHASVLIADPAQGGLWLGFHLGGVAYFADNQVRASYTSTDGLGGGRVNQLRLDPGGALWAATEGGLSRLKNGRIATLSGKNGLPCDTVHWAMEDDAHAFWLYTACGLVRIARPELDAWAAAVEEDGDAEPTIHVTVFYSSDGVRLFAGTVHYSPQVAKTSDGRLWFAGLDGVSVVDPKHLPFNSLPPPVHVEQVIADRTIYDAASFSNGQMRLPPLVRDLQIDYTALSLVAPEKVRFRYRLDGYDRDWQDAGNRRQAFYTNLRPGNYTFRVIACNNDGVWNETGAALSFYIKPAFYQTYWFLLLCLLTVVGLICLLYVARVRRVAAIYKGRMEERIGERERIARDLHDTFLQSVQGLILKFDAVAKQIPPEQPARQSMENALDRADEVMAEGRERVRNLRDNISLSDLPAAFAHVADEISNDQITFKTVVEGRARNLNPLVVEETYAIGREAILNAFTHSGGSQVEVEITYDRREFRVRIRDDGRGIDSQILKQGGRTDHFGLQGMRERANRMGAQLNLWSGSEKGTEVELLVPAKTAYQVSASKPNDFLHRGSLDDE